jgi:Tse3 toxin immunity protein Tsi3
MATQERQDACTRVRARDAWRAWPLLLASAALSCGDRGGSTHGGAGGAGGAAGAAGAPGAAGGGGGADAGAEVALPSLNMTMRLPKKDAEVLVGGRNGVRIMLEPRARAPRLIEISPQGADSVPKGASSQRALKGGGQLRYGVSQTGGGSGGPEIELVGELTWGGRSYLVICRAQGDPPPAAEWCLPYLDALRSTEG